MRVNREISDPDLAGFLQTADEDAIRLALAGNGEEARDALRAALEAGADSGIVEAKTAFSRLLLKYQGRIA